MKKILTIILSLTVGLAAHAQKVTDLNKAVVNVIAYDAEGNILNNAYGFLIGNNGEAVASFQALKGATRADVINWQGQTAHIGRIIGASSEYDLVRFTTDFPTKKLIALEPATQHADKGQTLQVAYYSADKKSTPETTTVTAADLYNDHYYYELSTANEERYFGCPVLDAAGHAVALVQKNVQKDATQVCAIDINFATELSTSALSAFNADLNSIKIAKRIPLDDETGAFSYVYMMLHSQPDTELAKTAAEDFIANYPANAKIYAERATFYANQGMYAEAQADLDKAISMTTESEGDFYNNQSQLMYNKVLSTAGNEPDPYPGWNLDTALESAEKAYAAQPHPMFLLQQGKVLFAQEKYNDAYTKFTEVNKSEIASAQTYYLAANALELAQGDETEIITLLDSAMARVATPYTAEVAAYILARANHLDNIGQHRRAVRDFNEYEKIIGPRNLTAYFYYLRMQAELSGKMYQQSLDDIATAISKATTSDEKQVYLIECARLQLQLGLYDECITTCTNALTIAADQADIHKICGIAYGEKKQKSKAREHLQRAKELGAENIDRLIEQYK